jgi:hypothetical protein
MGNKDLRFWQIMSLLKSAFERNFYVMQLTLVKIKWQIKWKYIIQKFHDICHSYYFKGTLSAKIVMQMICAWPKIWTLLGRLSLMRTVQLMKKMSDASKNIFRVYHIRIIYYISFGWRNFFPENSIWNTAVPLLSYSCMFQVEICSQQLEICKSVCMLCSWF